MPFFSHLQIEIFAVSAEKQNKGLLYLRILPRAAKKTRHQKSAKSL